MNKSCLFLFLSFLCVNFLFAADKEVLIKFETGPLISPLYKDRVVKFLHVYMQFVKKLQKKQPGGLYSLQRLFLKESFCLSGLHIFVMTTFKDCNFLDCHMSNSLFERGRMENIAFGSNSGDSKKPVHSNILTGSIFQSMSMKNIVFDNTDLTNATMNNVEFIVEPESLTYTFNRTCLNNVLFRNCSMIGLKFYETSLQRALFVNRSKPIDQEQIEQACIRVGSDIQSAGLARMLDIEQAKITLEDAYFNHCNLVAAAFYAVNLEGASFLDSNIETVDFQHCNLSKADFSKAQFSKDFPPFFTTSDLTGAKFTKAQVACLVLCKSQLAKIEIIDA